MKRLLPVFLILALVLSACGQPSNSESLSDDGRIKISTSIASIQWVVDQIGGEQVQTQSLTTSGDDPHTYEPTPEQMTAIADSDLYLSVGVEFEAVWLPKFKSANENLEIIDITEGVERIPGVEHDHGDHDHAEGDHGDHDHAEGDHAEHDHAEDDHAEHDHAEDDHAEHEHAEHEHAEDDHAEHDHAEDGHADHDHDEDHSHDGLDPHVWLSPENMEQIARNIAAILEDADPQNAPVFQSNLEKTIDKIDEVDRQVTQLLGETERKEFLIIHPSLGYLAEAYGLVMIPVEVDGQEPSPAQLAEILAASQTYGIHTLFTQPGISPLNAQTFATQAGINEIIDIDPLTYDWEANMLFIAESLKGALN